MAAKLLILCGQTPHPLQPSRSPCRFSCLVGEREISSCPFKALEMPLSCHLGMMECAVVSRHAWLVELEIQRDRGYHSASPHVISAGETDLTQMKCVTRRGFGNKTRQTVGKTNQNTTDTHTQTPALPHSVLEEATQEVGFS